MGLWPERVIFVIALFVAITVTSISSAIADNNNNKNLLNAAAKQNQQVARSLSSRDVTTWQAKFTPEELKIHMGTSEPVLLELTNVDTSNPNYRFQLRSLHPGLASVNHVITANDIDPTSSSWRGNITIDAIFLGATNITVDLFNTLTNVSETNDNMLQLIIVRRTRIIDHIFTGSVALLVSLLYINFGAALNLSVLRGIITRPIGPSIGFATQFVLMPLLSYGLGLLIFPNSVEMQLGMFFTGVSPSGGASNIWTVVLGGNIDLSVLMTTIGNFAAFGMMPLWLFTLGQVIFDRANMQVPYQNIATFAVALVVPLGIGLCIQKWSPRVTRILVRLLKPISTGLILFIVVFAIITNLYIFQLFSWEIVVAGLALPWLGYMIGWIAAKVLRQNSRDSLTIAIETGIQNTGISIFLLRFSLPQPQADLTTVIPVAVAIMTPLPLLGLYIYRRITGRNIKDGVAEQTETTSTVDVEPHNGLIPEVK